jgi:hypothetical protein
LANRYVSYIRSRPSRQAETVFGVEAQRRVVARFVGEAEDVLLEEFWEVEASKPLAPSPSAVFGQRPALNQAIRYCQAEQATLLIAHIGKLATSTTFLERLEQTKIPFAACDLPSLDHQSIGKAIDEARQLPAWQGPRAKVRTKSSG